jgi:L-lactate dehydrogenase complex protein LldG
VIHIATTVEHAAEIVLGILEEIGGRELLAWDWSEIPIRGLGNRLTAHGYTSKRVSLSSSPEERKASLMELERASAGITGAFAGIADTGSLVLVSSPARPRLASLLPPTHIAILPVSHLFPDMAAFFAAHPVITEAASNLTIITGPSRTADIELTLQRGVHGPKFLHVILLDRD